MSKTLKERLALICQKLGDDPDSDNCSKIRELIQTCPSCRAFVDSVNKTIQLYQDPVPPHSEDIHQRLLHKLNLD